MLNFSWRPFRIYIRIVKSALCWWNFFNVSLFDDKSTFAVFANDQQLYKVTVQMMMKGYHPREFEKFIPCLGGMLMFLSFVGSVGSLMANTLLQEVIQAAFAGVPNMLRGKKFPQNIFEHYDNSWRSFTRCACEGRCAEFSVNDVDPWRGLTRESYDSSFGLIHSSVWC